MSNAYKPKVLIEFQNACKEYVVFYGFVCDGMPSFRQFIGDLMNRHKLGVNDPFRVGVGNPVSGLYPASISLGNLLKKSDQNGDFKYLIANLTIVAIYSIWEDRYRNKIAQELKLFAKNAKNRIKSNIMGDLRLVRICIVHKNSLLSDEALKFKVLDPSQYPPEPLQITRKMMVEIMDAINKMEIKIDAE